MKIPCIPSPALSVCIAAILAAPVGRAQSTGGAQAAPAAASVSAPGHNEVVTTPSFDVTSDPAHGYVASESETGTRIATQIADLPFVVDVVTSPFIKDFAEYTMNQ